MTTSKIKFNDREERTANWLRNQEWIRETNSKTWLLQVKVAVKPAEMANKKSVSTSIVHIYL